jgi:hypothetical protein
MTGPALRNVEARLDETQGLDRAWLNKWIRNSAGLIKSGDAYANQIYNEYNGTAMTAFPQLSDQDITDILTYTAAPKPAPPVPPAGAVGVSSSDTGGTSNKLILGALALLFALLALALILVRKTLNRFAEEKGIEAVKKDKGLPIWKAFAQNQFLVLVSVIFLLLSSASKANNKAKAPRINLFEVPPVSEELTPTAPAGGTGGAGLGAAVYVKISVIS